MTSARNRATARTRRVNTALVAGAVFASVGVGSALVGNQIASATTTTTSGSGTSTSSTTHESTAKKFFNGLLGGGSSSSSSSSSNQSHATSNGS